ncbi:MAG: Hpt domain-containing protein [bacterium]|nr:Hpt domain-containing protein [bacterium]
MSRLKYPGKFLVIAALGLFPLALTSYLLISEINSGIAFAEAELEGIERALPIGEVLHYTPVRALGLIGYSGYLDREYSTHNEALNEAFARLQAAGAAAADDEEQSRIATQLADLGKKWTELEENWEKLDAVALSDRYGFLMDDIKKSAATSGESSKLVFEPDVGGNNLAQILTHYLPETQPELLRMSVLASRLIFQDTRDARNARIRLAAHGEALKLHLQQLNFALETAFNHSPEIRAALDTARKRNHINTIRLLNTTLEGIVFAERAALTSPEYLESVGKVSESNFELYNSIANSLKGIVQQRMESLKFRRNLILAISLAAILLVLYLFLGFYRNVMQTVASLGEVADRMISGETDQPLTLTGRDELNDIGLAFNRIGIALLGAKKETDRILANTDEGLFLIAQDHLIGAQFSARLTEILGRTDLAQKSLKQILEGRVAGSALDGLERFLRLMFQQHIEDEVLADLNPLKHIEVQSSDAAPGTKYLEFGFNRIVEEASVLNLMVTVRDVTAQVELQRQLEETQAKNKSAMEKLFRVIHIEPAMLASFLRDASHELDQVRAAFRQEKSAASFREDLPAIGRRLHSIKGNASLLELTFISDEVHELEDLLQKLIEKQEDLSGVDILPLTMGVSSLEEQFAELVALVERLRGFHDGARNGSAGADEVNGNANGTIAASVELDAIRRGLEQLIANEAGPRGKQIQLTTRGFDAETPAQLTPETIGLLKDVIVQLTRNSIAHGIETGEERKAKGKAPTGSIEMRLESDIHAPAPGSALDPDQTGGDTLRLVFRDDGAGLNLNGLREKAKASGQWSEEEIAGWNDNRVAQLIYASGLSTAESADSLAGRGVGMDVIRQRVREAGGKLGLRFAAGRFTEFTIQVPVQQAVQAPGSDSAPQNADADAETPDLQKQTADDER